VAVASAGQAGLGYNQICTSHQTDNHARTPPLSCFTGRMPFLPPNQQHQTTEGKMPKLMIANTIMNHFIFHGLLI